MVVDQGSVLQSSELGQPRLAATATPRAARETKPNEMSSGEVKEWQHAAETVQSRRQQTHRRACFTAQNLTQNCSTCRFAGVAYRQSCAGHRESQPDRPAEAGIAIRRGKEKRTKQFLRRAPGSAAMRDWRSDGAKCIEGKRHKTASAVLHG